MHTQTLGECFSAIFTSVSLTFGPLASSPHAPHPHSPPPSSIMGYFDETIGAAFIGFAVSCVLFGILSTQVYDYFQRFTLDRTVYKFFVSQYEST